MDPIASTQHSTPTNHVMHLRWMSLGFLQNKSHEGGHEELKLLHELRYRLKTIGICVDLHMCRRIARIVFETLMTAAVLDHGPYSTYIFRVLNLMSHDLSQ